MQTSEEINNQIDAQIAANPLLAGLTSSNASEWKLWKSVFVYASLSLQFLWEQFRVEILGLIAANKIGSAAWYVAQAKAFQMGDALVNDNGVLKYPIIDASKQIIIQAAAVAQNGKVLIKVATEDGVLTTEEKAAFVDYWEDVKPFAQALQVVSEQPDKVKAVMIIYFDGKLLQADVEAAVEAAVNNYITTKLEFNGNFNINRFRDTIEEALHALSSNCDVNIENLQIKAATGSYTNVTYKYIPLSGRYQFGWPDDATPADRSTITYIRI